MVRNRIGFKNGFSKDLEVFHRAYPKKEKLIDIGFYPLLFLGLD